mmetsp:Transcript_18248/g.28798  ORF Transcript_18248/g.28798 Transcript_18248/m.28798 type:complete len:262 (+) Transcript_18248:400-1185(+)
MPQHQRAQRPRIAEGAGENFAIGHHVVAIGKGDGACIEQESDLRHLAALTAFGQRRHRQDVDRGRLAGAADHEFERFWVVDGRVRVRPRDHGRDTACRGGKARAAKALFVALAGFTNLHADVDDARAKVLAVTVNGLARLGQGGVVGDDSADLAAGDPDGARCHGACLRVDELGVGEKEVSHPSKIPVSRSSDRTGFSNAPWNATIVVTIHSFWLAQSSGSATPLEDFVTQIRASFFVGSSCQSRAKPKAASILSFSCFSR